MAGRTSAPGATVTSRALALLGAFDEKHRRLTLTELAGRAGLPVPTAHRLVAELVDVGRAGHGSRPATTSSAAGSGTSGCSPPCRPGCGELASPFLHDLYGATLATVHLAVRDGTRGPLRRPAAPATRRCRW